MKKENVIFYEQTLKLWTVIFDNRIFEKNAVLWKLWKNSPFQPNQSDLESFHSSWFELQGNFHAQCKWPIQKNWQILVKIPHKKFFFLTSSSQTLSSKHFFKISPSFLISLIIWINCSSLISLESILQNIKSDFHSTKKYFSVRYVWSLESFFLFLKMNFKALYNRRRGVINK